MNQADHIKYTLNEWHQPEFIAFLEKAKELTPIKTVYDIGACVGGWSEVCSEVLDADIYAFEPDLENYRYILENTINSKITPIHLGVFYGKDHAEAHGCSDSNVGGYFLEGIHTYGQSVGKRFELCELESLNIPKPQLIKMDIEGAEKNLIENSEIVKKCPLLLVEWHFQDDPEEFFARHLEHKVVHSLDGKMFLLAL